MPDLADRSRTFEVQGDYLVETYDECTCEPYYGAHEEYCGLEPVAEIKDILKSLEITGSRTNIVLDLADVMSVMWMTRVYSGLGPEIPDEELTKVLSSYEIVYGTMVDRIHELRENFFGKFAPTIDLLFPKGE